jgi:hypothetical protein
MNGLLVVEHAESMTWAISQGVEINGVAPAKLPGQGLTDSSVNYETVILPRFSRSAWMVRLTSMCTVIAFPHPLPPNP